jgi:hypothetical protein
MHYDITPDTVAQVIYQQAICPTGDPQDALNDWMKVSSGLGCFLANWQRLASGQPGYEGQTEALTTALLKAEKIMRCLARAA